MEQTTAYTFSRMWLLVCHTAPLENAISILQCGLLLSSVKARKLPDTVLQKEDRNAANDPLDYFHYVMFTWGNCQAGDRLVMERKLKLYLQRNFPAYRTILGIATNI